MVTRLSVILICALPVMLYSKRLSKSTFTVPIVVTFLLPVETILWLSVDFLLNT
jgi:hypothetical protein